MPSVVSEDFDGMVYIHVVSHFQAKGYPDLSTRQFVNMIYTKYPSLPFYALVDADPHGVCIYLTYKFGSLVSLWVTCY